MADFTVRLVDLIKSGYDVESKAMASWPSPTDEWRNEVNAAILRHYYFREIGAETADMFSFFLDAALNEVMPYYNERRAANLLDIGVDPLVSFSTQTNTSGTNEGTRTSNSTDKNTHTINRTTKDDYSNTNTSTINTSGQSNTEGSTTDTSSNSSDGYNKEYAIPTTGGSSGNAPGGFSDDYATGGSVNHVSGTANGSGTNKSDTTSSGKTENSGSGTNTGTRTESGGDVDEGTRNGSETSKGSSASNTTSTGTNIPKFELLAKYRETIENVIAMIIHNPKISQCFMGIYGGDTGDY